MWKKIKYCAHVVVEKKKCGKCGRHFYVGRDRKSLEVGGWERRWSWWRLCFIWVCPGCLAFL
ncbi:MAG: hypothetical protein AAB509_03720 [Patescibacteria group bacterium]